MKDFPANERESYQTLGGFVLTRMAKLPRIGEKFEWENYTFEVVDMDGKRVDELLVTPIKQNDKN